MKAVADTPAVQLLASMLGKKIKYADPEVEIWASTIYRIKSGLVGAAYGAFGQVSLDLLNKLLYRIELTARYKHPISNGNVALQMLALSNNAAKLVAKGASGVIKEWYL